MIDYFNRNCHCILFTDRIKLKPFLFFNHNMFTESMNNAQENLNHVGQQISPGSYIHNTSIPTDCRGK